MEAVAILAVSAGLPPAAGAGYSPGLSTVVVTATRVATAAFDVPASVSSVPGTQLRLDALGVNFAESVQSVAGLLARNQYNYAQDQQISIRGIGAESPFGVRGVRIYQDGIPQSGPDGLGAVSQFNLESAARVEVLEGPFSALYGNSSGGVIQLFTAKGVSPGSLRLDVGFGSFGAWRAGADANDAVGALSYNVDFTHFGWRGFRPHQSARSESFNGKVEYAFGPRDKLTFVANVLSRPDSADPQGLTAAQFAADPNQTSESAIAFDTRQSLRQVEGGLICDLGLTAHQSVRLMGYYGHRAVLQFLSIPVPAQRAPTSSGGVVDFHRDFGGADVRWTEQAPVAGDALSWIVGLSYDSQNELRLGYDNFVGDRLGVEGALRRDENDIERDFDEYTQASLSLSPRWTLTVGLRHSEVRFVTEDHFLGNGSGSGEVTYSATSPVVGILYVASRWLHLYGSFGRGFRTPLDTELAYRPDGRAGLNLALRPARSNNGEIGAKIRVGRTLLATFAAFDTDTAGEIVVVSDHGGRSTYENAGRTRRSGAQASVEYRFGSKWLARLAYTYIDAIYVDAYRTCAAVPCLTPTRLVPAGNHLAGVPRNYAFVQLAWGGKLGWHASVSGQYMGAIPVDSTNSEFAGAYSVFDVSGGYRAALGAQRLEAFLRVNNMLDRRYVGAVIVNEGSGAFYEPAPGFNVFSGLTVTFH